jgi:hypothetical protein
LTKQVHLEGKTDPTVSRFCSKCSKWQKNDKKNAKSHAWKVQTYRKKIIKWTHTERCIHRSKKSQNCAPAVPKQPKKWRNHKIE